VERSVTGKGQKKLFKFLKKCRRFKVYFTSFSRQFFILGRGFVNSSKLSPRFGLVYLIKGKHHKFMQMMGMPNYFYNLFGRLDDN